MSHAWSALPERSNAFWLWIIRTVALRIGRLPARLLLYPITAFFLVVAAPQRRASLVYLTRVLGRPATWWDVARHILTFSRTLVDRVYLFSGQLHRLDVHFHNRELVLEHLRDKKPAILLGSHLGSFEILRALGLLEIEMPLKILMYKDHNRVFNRMIHALNPGFLDTLIEPGQPTTTLEIHDSLANGFFVGMLGDRPGNVQERVTHCRFFGREAIFPAGPILLAHLTKVPVILFFGLYRGGKRYDVYFKLLAERVELERKNRDTDIQHLMQRYADSLEAHTRDAPFNWFNFYDFWNEYSPSSRNPR